MRTFKAATVLGTPVCSLSLHGEPQGDVPEFGNT